MNIIIKNLKKTFEQDGQRPIVVLDDLSMTFEQGKSYAITGASGTGKSTFLHLIAGIDDPDSGSVTYGDKKLETMSLHEKEAFLNKTVGLMFQQPYLISELSVIENVSVKGMIIGKTFAQCKCKALEILTELDIADKANCMPDTLSGGQQQRVALGRAIFNEPKFLLADEPTGNLDPKTGKLIVDLLLKCNKNWGMGLIISSHDSYVAQNMEYKFKLENGKLDGIVR